MNAQILDEDGNIENLPVYVDSSREVFQLYPVEINGKLYKILAPTN